jgi:hypothetical protein
MYTTGPSNRLQPTRNQKFQFKTWHFEVGIVAIILCTITFFFANNWTNWIATAAVIITFNHATICDRLQEKQSRMIRPTVECYHKLHRLFVSKEILWIVFFIMTGSYSAIVGSGLFALYPLWRKLYRRHIKPSPPDDPSGAVILLD